MNKTLAVVLAISGCVGVIASAVMVIMAVQFMELGRVVFYLSLAFVCFGIAFWGFNNLFSKKE